MPVHVNLASGHKKNENRVFISLYAYRTLVSRILQYKLHERDLSTDINAYSKYGNEKKRYGMDSLLAALIIGKSTLYD